MFAHLEVRAAHSIPENKSITLNEKIIRGGAYQLVLRLHVSVINPRERILNQRELPSCLYGEQNKKTYVQ